MVTWSSSSWSSLHSLDVASYAATILLRAASLVVSELCFIISRSVVLRLKLLERGPSLARNRANTYPRNARIENLWTSERIRSFQNRFRMQFCRRRHQNSRILAETKLQKESPNFRTHFRKQLSFNPFRNFAILQIQIVIKCINSNNIQVCFSWAICKYIPPEINRY